MEFSGQVVIRETGSGIPNLVVRAYLIDAAADTRTKQGLTAAALLRFGTLVSSTITNVDGIFDFSAEDQERRETEVLSHIAIAICAPEVVLESSSRHIASQEHGVLSVTLFPRVEAGARIALPIRVAKEVVAPFLISADESQVRTGMDRNWAAHDTANNTLKARHVAELERGHEARTYAKKAVLNLHAVPMALRSHPFLVTNRAELGQPVDRKRKGRPLTTLESQQEEAMVAGLINWRKKKRTRRSRLYLKYDELKELGLAYQNGALSHSKTTLAKLNALTLKLNGGTDLVLKKTPDPGQLHALELKYLKAAPAPKKPKNSQASEKKSKPARSAKKRQRRSSKSGGNK